MPALAGAASLLLGLLALGLAVYLFVLLRKTKEELTLVQDNVRTIAAHIEEEVHPAVEWLSARQEERLEANFGEVATTTEEEIAQAMLCSMLGGMQQQRADSHGQVVVEEIVSEEDDDDDEQAVIAEPDSTARGHGRAAQRLSHITEEEEEETDEEDGDEESEEEAEEQ